MNFLQICQQVRELSGISGVGPTSVLNQSGEMLRIVNWVKSSWIDVQNISPYWNWMYRPFSFTTTTNQQAYTLAQMGTPDLRRLDNDSLRSYVTSAGIANEEYMQYWNWLEFYDVYLYGQTQFGKPYMFAVDPQQKNLNLALVPDSTGYTIRGRYWQVPQEFVNNDDEPGLPSEYHMIIVYRALMKYAGYANAPEQKQEAIENYYRLLTALQNDQLPNVQMGSALA